MNQNLQNGLIRKREVKKVITKCHICGSKVIEKKVSIENWWGDTFIIVEGVPALLCENCGEQYFDAETSLMLDKMRKKSNTINPKRIMEVPVYEYPLESSQV
jgi:YgiT-type zinc finger domain-containing protein